MRCVWIPAWYGPWRVRAQARLEMGNLDGAADDLAETLGRDNEDIDALVLRGRINEARRLQGG